MQSWSAGQREATASAARFHSGTLLHTVNLLDIDILRGGLLIFKSWMLLFPHCTKIIKRDYFPIFSPLRLVLCSPIFVKRKKEKDQNDAKACLGPRYFSTFCTPSTSSKFDSSITFPPSFGTYGALSSFSKSLLKSIALK